MKNQAKLILTDLRRYNENMHYGDNPDFRIIRIFNSIQYIAGNGISAKEVDNLIQQGWEVTIEQYK